MLRHVFSQSINITVEDLVQLLGHLPNIHEALGLIPKTIYVQLSIIYV